MKWRPLTDPTPDTAALTPSDQERYEALKTWFLGRGNRTPDTDAKALDWLVNRIREKPTDV